MILNSIVIKVYEGWSTTLRDDPAQELSLAQNVKHQTVFPYGLYGPASFFIPRDDPTRNWSFRAGDRVVIENGLEVVWEGEWGNVDIGDTGLAVSCNGAWGAVMGQQRINKRWADSRLDQFTPTTGFEVNKFNFQDRLDRLKVTPLNDVSFYNGDKIELGFYQQPTGETVKRMTFNYDLAETGVIPPKRAKFNNDADNTDTFTDLDNATDGDAATEEAVTLQTDDYLYVQKPDGIEIDGIRFDFGSSVNNNTATLTVERYTEQLQDKTPLAVKHYNGISFTDLTNTFDDNAGTSSNVTLSKGDFLYIQTADSNILGLRFDLGGSTNNNVADMKLQRYNGTSWTSVKLKEDGALAESSGDDTSFAQDGTLLWSATTKTTATAIDSVTGLWWRLYPSATLDVITINEIYAQIGWESVSIADGTASGGAPFAQDGDITFTYPSDEKETRIDGNTGLWWRISTSATLDAVDIKEISILDRQQWKLALWNNTDSSDEWSVSASGSGSADITFGTADDNPGFYFVSEANQTGIGNGSIYGELSSIIVYSETGSITVNSTIQDILDTATYLNSDNQFLDANTLSIEPFVTDGYESLASISERVAAYGDSSQNSWNVYLKWSGRAAAPDGQPILALEQYPALSDYDYAIRYDDETIESSLSIVQDNNGIANYIIVEYVNVANDDIEYLIPDDDSSLKDTASINEYNERHAIIDAGIADSTTALNFGKRYLAEHKDPEFSVSGPIKITGFIRSKEGLRVPAANIRAGKVLKLQNFLHDLTPTANAGLVSIISETMYNDADQTCSISLGLPDDASLLIARSLTDIGASGSLTRRQK